MNQEGSSHLLQNDDLVRYGFYAEQEDVESHENEEIDDGKLMRFDGIANALWWDVIIVAGGGEKFYVTKGHLAQHSQQFAEIFIAAEAVLANEGMKTNRNGIGLEDLDPVAFQAFLEVINGEPGLNDENVEGVLKIAKKYAAPTAKKNCELYLINDSKLHHLKKLNLAREYGLYDLREAVDMRHQGFFRLDFDDPEVEQKREQLQAKLVESTRRYNHACEQLKKQLALDMAIKNEEKRRNKKANGSCHVCGTVYGNGYQWGNVHGNGVGYVNQNVGVNQWGNGNGIPNGNGHQWGNGNGVSHVYQYRNGHTFQSGNGLGNGVGYGNQWRNGHGNQNGNGYQWGNGSANGAPNPSQAYGNPMGNGNSHQWRNGSANNASNSYPFCQGHSQH
ncbi:hypothetical protein CAEBREN_02394 [Caenorhabditis brenneri]|uniref:BTB domain-containing protein n=1 Tax=Caenorhabditis brenneri TaxID=135651 RepID=G0MV07_CAEBE|nr:hypothetical protein CAEBREN_02394 [Caenorhabditis brenneri]